MINSITMRWNIGKAKIAITLCGELIEEIYLLIKAHKFMNRSQAIQEVVKDKLQRLKKVRLAEACSKLDVSFEKMTAEEGIFEDLTECPEY
jgi:metal-responsive CopG/Arc/MetJ family transcriptional regulator